MLCSQNNHFASAFAAIWVVSKLGAVNIRDFQRYFGKTSEKDINVKQKQKKQESDLVKKNLCLAQSENLSENSDGFVACWPSEQRKQQIWAASSAAEIKNTCQNDSVEQRQWQ